MLFNVDSLQVASIRTFIGRVDRFCFRMVKVEYADRIPDLQSAFVVYFLNDWNTHNTAKIAEETASLNAVNTVIENHENGSVLKPEKVYKKALETQKKLSDSVQARKVKAENVLLFVSQNADAMNRAKKYFDEKPACDGLYFDYLYKGFCGSYYIAERHGRIAELIPAVVKEKRTSHFVQEKKISDTINGRTLIDLVKRDFKRFCHDRNNDSWFRPYVPNMKTWEYAFVADFISNSVMKDTKDGVVLAYKSNRQIARELFQFQLMKLQGHKIVGLNADDLKELEF